MAQQRRLPNSKVKKALLAGTTSVKRVAGEAIPQAGDLAADILEQIGIKAEGVARTFGRKTIMPEDLKQACQVVWGGSACEKITSTGKIKRKRKAAMKAPWQPESSEGEGTE